MGVPVLFVCGTTSTRLTTAAEIALAIPDVAEKAAGYGISGEVVDWQDVLAVYEVASRAVERAREGGGPTLLEAKTYRFTAHAGAGTGQHNNPEELACWMERDPICMFEQKLIDDGLLTALEQETVRDEVLAEVRRRLSLPRTAASRGLRRCR